MSRIMGKKKENKCGTRYHCGMASADSSSASVPLTYKPLSASSFTLRTGPNYAWRKTKVRL